MSTPYEYGIAFRNQFPPKTTRSVHREDLTEDEARTWLDGWVEDGGNPKTFIVIRRPIGQWEEAP